MADGRLRCHKAGAEEGNNQPSTMKMNKKPKGKILQGMKQGLCTEEVFCAYMRESIRGALWELMQEEVEAHCGRRHRPDREGRYRRAGSDDGVFYFAGRKEAVKKPRMRERLTGGRQREAVLESYLAARSKRNILSEVMAMVDEGVSARGSQRLTGRALSSSEVSRQWVKHSARRIEELRGRDLSKDEYFGLMMDGVFLKETVVLVALGIKKDGSKEVLDFSVGSSESYEVARSLCSRLQERRFNVRGRLLAVLDGARALHRAVEEFWPDAVVQDCIIHKERNLHGYLRKSDHAECSRLVKRLRLAQGAEAGREALAALRKFLKERNAAALASLEESGERLIALHLLDVPATLNVSLLSTNLIENALHNYRRQTRRVTRWDPKSNQVERWSASALLWVERGFRKIKGYEDLPYLLSALARPTSPWAHAASCVAASPLRGTPASQETASTPLAA